MSQEWVLMEPLYRSLKERCFNGSITLLDFENHLCLTVFSTFKNKANKNVQ